MSSTPLAALERSRLEFGAAAAEAELALLKQLVRTRLGSARAVARFHEALCWSAPTPTTRPRSRWSSACSTASSAAPTCAPRRAALADSGIAGTDDLLSLLRLHGRVALLALARAHRPRLVRHAARHGRGRAPRPPAAARLALRRDDGPGRGGPDRPRVAAAPARRILRRHLPAARPARHRRQPLRARVPVGAPRPAAPAARRPRRPLALARPARARPPRFRAGPRAPCRPSLPAAADRPAPRRARPAARARAARSSTSRATPWSRAPATLDAFSSATRATAAVDDGEGLAFALVGFPARAAPMLGPSTAATLRTACPSATCRPTSLGRSAALSFNIFETFRGGEAAGDFARWLARCAPLLGATPSPSSLPAGRGQRGGASLPAPGGSTPSSASGRASRPGGLARAELSRVERSPRHRTRVTTLRRLAERHLFFDLEPARALALFPLAALGLRSGAALSARAGSDRERAVDEASTELLHHCALGIAARVLAGPARGVASPRADPHAARPRGVAGR